MPTRGDINLTGRQGCQPEENTYGSDANQRRRLELINLTGRQGCQPEEKAAKLLNFNTT